MIADDYIRMTFREIRQAYHSAVNEWGIGDRDAMKRFLLIAETKTHSLIERIDDERTGKVS